ncbi:MAG: hypothetical protein ABW003_07060 [Microvirga sp.]
MNQKHEQHLGIAAAATPPRSMLQGLSWRQLACGLVVVSTMFLFAFPSPPAWLGRVRGGVYAALDTGGLWIVQGLPVVLDIVMNWLEDLFGRIDRFSAEADDRTMLMACCLVVSIVAGLIAAATVYIHRRDTTLRTVGDVAAASAVSFAGALPEIPNRNPEHGQAQFAEAVWELAVGLNLVGNLQSQVVMVTSAQPGDGKTVLTIGLAKCLSELGQEVLVVNTTPGSGEHVPDAGKTTLESLMSAEGPTFLLPEVAQQVRMVGRSAGTGCDRRLFGPGFRALLEDARARYDTILIEAPATSTFPDALILGRTADMIVVVARAKHTRCSALRGCLQRLAVLPTRIAGVVLSRAAIEAKYSARGSASLRTERFVAP